MSARTVFTVFFVWEENKKQHGTGSRSSFTFGETEVPLAHMQQFQTFGEAYEYVAHQAQGHTMTESVTYSDHIHYRWCEREEHSVYASEERRSLQSLCGMYRTRQFCIVPCTVFLHDDKPMVDRYIGDKDFRIEGHEATGSGAEREKRRESTVW